MACLVVEGLNRAWYIRKLMLPLYSCPLHARSLRLVLQFLLLNSCIQQLHLVHADSLLHVHLTHPRLRNHSNPSFAAYTCWLGRQPSRDGDLHLQLGLQGRGMTSALSATKTSLNLDFNKTYHNKCEPSTNSSSFQPPDRTRPVPQSAAINLKQTT